ncbi:glycosyltransferase family 2 protein [Clostridium sp. JNZ X4-2]
MLILYIIVKKYARVKFFFAMTVIVLNLIYIIWRIKYTIPTTSKIGMVLGVALILSELLGFFQSTIYSILFYKPYKPKEMKMEDLNRLPTIDVLIMTYNEPTYVLRKTIAGCLNIEYPDNLLNIYICDDGHRDEIEKLAGFFKIHYVTRENNDFAKAGNINNALSNYCRGELFSVLDADMIPKPNYLKKMVGYFKENNVGFIQSPQVFYNPDPFQYNLNLDDKIPNEQDFFMREVQAGRARYNALFHVGTNALFSRKAIDDIGGIPTGSITEDMATGMLLQARGYKSVFVNEILAVGLSAEYYKDFAKQRKRWCRGNIQVSKKWNPLTMKGLTFIQRLLYFSGILYWYSGVSKMIYILCPIIYLIFGTLIIKASTMQLLQFFVPSYVSYILMFKSHSSQYRSLILNHIYECATSPFLALASLSELIFARELKFNVTLKGHIKRNIFVSWGLLVPQLVLFIMTILGFGISLNKNFAVNSIELKESITINIIWAGYNLIGIVMTMLLSLEKPRYRSSERRIVDCKSSLILSDSTALNCRINDISDSGIGISINSNKLGHLDVGDIIKIKIGEGDAFCRILRCRENNFGCRFINLSREQYLNIVKYEFHNENGYYSVEKQSFAYNKLEGKDDNKLEPMDDDIFKSNVVTAAFPGVSIKEAPEANYIAAKPIENEVITENQNDIKTGYYANLPADVILKDIAKLNDTQITIIKMYKEITDLKEQLKNNQRD